MDRYRLFRLLFVLLGVVAPVLSTVPLLESLELATALLMVVPVVLVILVLSMAMFFGWQGGALGALFSGGIFAAILLEISGKATNELVIAIGIWLLFYLVVGVLSGLIFDESSLGLKGLTGEIDRGSGLRSEDFFRRSLAAEVERSRRYDKTFSVMILGFEALENVPAKRTGFILQKAAIALYGRYRSTDLLCRWGNGLGLVLPNTTVMGASILRSRMESYFAHDHELNELGGPNLTVTTFTFPEDEAEIVALAAPYASFEQQLPDEVSDGA